MIEERETRLENVCHGSRQDKLQPTVSQVLDIAQDSNVVGQPIQNPTPDTFRDCVNTVFTTAARALVALDDGRPEVAAELLRQCAALINQQRCKG